MRLWKSILSAATIALASCSSQIDYRNVDIYNGLVYKHGSDQPFSGTVVYQGVPSIVNRYFSITRGLLTQPGLTGGDNTCYVQYVKGDAEGNIYCEDVDGDKTVSFTLSGGTLNGSAETFNRGHSTSRMNWEKGRLDGYQKVLTSDGSVVTHEWTVVDGSKEGGETFRTHDGNVLAKGEWHNGRFSGTYFDGDSSVYTLRDGMKDGPFKTFEGNTTDEVSLEGAYSNNEPYGEWIYHHPENFLTGLTGGFFEGQPVPDGLLELLEIPDVAKIKVQRKNGRLEGEIQGFDKHDNAVVSFRFVDGSIKAPVLRFDPVAGVHKDYSDEQTLAALNYRSSRQMRLPGYTGSPFGVAAGQAAVSAEQAKQRDLESDRAKRVQNVVSMRQADAGLL